MQFLNPTWLWAAPPFCAALILLYFLKLKRRELPIASTYLWAKAIDDLRVNSPLQRLRTNLLLLLQLLILLAVIGALARPALSGGGLSSSDVVLLIDVSASMGSADADGERRIDRALFQARRIVDDLSAGDRAVVIAFSDEARVLTPLTNNRALLSEALEAVALTDRPTVLRNALERVGPVLEVGGGAASQRVYLFSDGRVGDLGGSVLPAGVELSYVRLGTSEANVGITGVDVRTRGLGEYASVFVTVFNAGEEEATVGMDVYLADDLVESRRVRVSGGGVVSVHHEVDADEEAVLRVELDTEGVGDPFVGDDRVVALVEPPRPVRVLLVSEGNVFLASALRSDPQVEVDARGQVPTLDPGSFDAEDPTLLDYDLIVLDRFAPPELPSGNFLMFGAAPPFEGFEDQGTVEVDDAWGILDWREEHPAARFVNFSTLVMPEGKRFVPRAGDTVVVDGDQGPIVVEAREGDAHVLACAFDLMSLPLDAAWTFDPSYPIFMSNVTRWLGGAGGGDRLLETGRVAEVRLPAWALRAEVTTPGGEVRELEVRPGDDVLRVSGLDRVGLYEVELLGEINGTERSETQRFAVNLVDQEESKVGSVETLELEGRDPIQGEEEAEVQNREIWKAVTLFALVFVLLEWWVYNRRIA